MKKRRCSCGCHAGLANSEPMVVMLNVVRLELLATVTARRYAPRVPVSTSSKQGATSGLPGYLCCQWTPVVGAALSNNSQSLSEMGSNFWIHQPNRRMKIATGRW